MACAFRNLPPHLQQAAVDLSATANSCSSVRQVKDTLRAQESGLIQITEALNGSGGTECSDLSREVTGLWRRLSEQQRLLLHAETERRELLEALHRQRRMLTVPTSAGADSAPASAAASETTRLRQRLARLEAEAEKHRAAVQVARSHAASAQDALQAAIATGRREAAAEADRRLAAMEAEVRRHEEALTECRGSCVRVEGTLREQLERLCAENAGDCLQVLRSLPSMLPLLENLAISDATATGQADGAGPFEIPEAPPLPPPPAPPLDGSVYVAPPVSFSGRRKSKPTAADAPGKAPAPIGISIDELRRKIAERRGRASEQPAAERRSPRSESRHKSDASPPPGSLASILAKRRDAIAGKVDKPRRRSPDIDDDFAV